MLGGKGLQRVIRLKQDQAYRVEVLLIGDRFLPILYLPDGVAGVVGNILLRNDITLTIPDDTVTKQRKGVILRYGEGEQLGLFAGWLRDSRGRLSGWRILRRGLRGWLVGGNLLHGLRAGAQACKRGQEQTKR